MQAVINRMLSNLAYSTDRVAALCSARAWRWGLPACLRALRVALGEIGRGGGGRGAKRRGACDSFLAITLGGPFLDGVPLCDYFFQKNFTASVSRYSSVVSNPAMAVRTSDITFRYFIYDRAYSVGA